MYRTLNLKLEISKQTAYSLLPSHPTTRTYISVQIIIYAKHDKPFATTTTKTTIKTRKENIAII